LLNGQCQYDSVDIQSGMQGVALAKIHAVAFLVTAINKTMYCIYGQKPQINNNIGMLRKNNVLQNTTLSDLITDSGRL
jgi:hypothetical protein